MYCKTGALGICVNFLDFLSDVLLMIFMDMNTKCQYDFIMKIKPVVMSSHSYFLVMQVLCEMTHYLHV